MELRKLLITVIGCALFLTLTGSNSSAEIHSVPFTQVKDQGRHGHCWLFAGVGYMEAVIKQFTKTDYHIPEYLLWYYHLEKVAHSIDAIELEVNQIKAMNLMGPKDGGPADSSLQWIADMPLVPVFKVEGRQKELFVNFKSTQPIFENLITQIKAAERNLVQGIPDGLSTQKLLLEAKLRRIEFKIEPAPDSKTLDDLVKQNKSLQEVFEKRWQQFKVLLKSFGDKLHRIYPIPVLAKEFALADSDPNFRSALENLRLGLSVEGVSKFKSQESILKIKSIIDFGLPVLLSYNHCFEFETSSGYRALVDNPNLNIEECSNAHVALVVGYETNLSGEITEFVIKNSWGIYNRGNGFFKMDNGYFERFAYAMSYSKIFE